jgi:hypothetical protein
MRVGITGHRGLPPETERLVDKALREFLATLDDADLVGITSLAGGADQLFARAILDLGGGLEVVVPAARYRDSLDPGAEQGGYDELFPLAQHVVRLPFRESTEESHMAAGQHVVETSDLIVAVWDREPARGHGGTADIVENARACDRQVEVIWPPGASRT